MKKNNNFPAGKKYNPVPNFESGIISEPLITFGGGHTHVDPKIGLGLYGPYNNPEHRIPSIRTITVGIVGPGTMIADAMMWLKACQGVLTNDGSQPFLYPHFPGINQSAPFQCELMYADSWSESIKESNMKQALGIPNFFERIDKIIELYTESIQIIAQRDPRPNVILCCFPQEVIELCTVKQNQVGEIKRIKLSKTEKLQKQIAAKAKRMGQFTLFDELGPSFSLEEDELVHQNLRRGLKAETMRFGIPTQIVWPRTLSMIEPTSKKREQSSQDIATKAWNFVTALYYKAGGSPWRLHQLDPGVCFIGISFFKDLNEKNSRMRTSMAQTFTAAGDGYVLRGNSFEWNESKNGKSPHLNKKNAAALIQNVLDLYKAQNRGQLPSRLVVHKTSKFWDDELEGFNSAAEIVPNKDYVAFGKRGIQFYRPGDYPPLRGTFVKFSNDNLLLYTTGYTSYLKSYKGPRVPKPLEIIQHIGDSPWNFVLKEVLALTKMNWNTADFACSYPITIAFSQKVGQILAELPEDLPGVRPEYRFYM